MAYEFPTDYDLYSIRISSEVNALYNLSKIKLEMATWLRYIEKPPCNASEADISFAEATYTVLAYWHNEWRNHLQNIYNNIFSRFN